MSDQQQLDPATGASDTSTPPPGPPYSPRYQGLGGVPSLIPDVPISTIFLFLFILGAATHFSIFKLNMKKSHKFFMSMMTFGFCMCRITTFILRLAWSSYPNNVSLGIAATIFVQAGTLLLYVINLVFAQRIIRAQHPRLGWNRIFSIMAKILIALVILTLLAIISVSIQSLYTLDTYTHYVDHCVQLAGITFYAILSSLPIPMVIIGLLLPRRIRAEKFGHGRFRHKVTILIAATLLCMLRAGFGCGISWMPATPLSQPTPWYLSKAAFYCFSFIPELCVVYLYAAVRVDRRFHVPNKARGSYMPHRVLSPFEKHQRHESDTGSILGAMPPSTTAGRNASRLARSVLGSLKRHASTAGAVTFPYLQSNWDDSQVLHVYSEDELFDDPGTLLDTLRHSRNFENVTLSRDDITGRWELRGRQSRVFRNFAYGAHHNYHHHNSTDSFLEAPPAILSTGYGGKARAGMPLKHGYKGDTYEMNKQDYDPYMDHLGSNSMGFQSRGSNVGSLSLRQGSQTAFAQRPMPMAGRSHGLPYDPAAHYVYGYDDHWMDPEASVVSLPMHYGSFPSYPVPYYMDMPLPPYYQQQPTPRLYNTYPHYQPNHTSSSSQSDLDIPSRIPIAGPSTFNGHHHHHHRFQPHPLQQHQPTSRSKLSPLKPAAVKPRASNDYLNRAREYQPRPFVETSTDDDEVEDIDRDDFDDDDDQRTERNSDPVRRANRETRESEVSFALPIGRMSEESVREGI